MSTSEKKRKAEPDLAECPFCGHPAKSEPWHGGPETKRLITCSNEYCAVGPTVSGDTYAEARERWNERAPLQVTVVLQTVRGEPQPLKLWAVYAGHLPLQEAIDRAKEEWKVEMRKESQAPEVYLSTGLVAFHSAHAEVRT